MSISTIKTDDWDDCIEYIIRHLYEFQDRYLSGGAYDYFPNAELKKWLVTLKGIDNKNIIPKG